MGTSTQNAGLGSTHAAHAFDGVAWLGDETPPSALTSYLQRQGITLVSPARGQPLPPARLTTLDALPRAARVPPIDGRRVLVLHPDAAAADAIVRALREQGAHALAGLQADSLSRIEELVPDVVLVDLADLHRSCWRFVRALWSHSWLRFSPLLLVPPGSLQVPAGGAWDLPEICVGLHALHQDYRKLTAKARKERELSLRLDRLGPVRTLRALMESGRSLRVCVDTKSHTFYVDFVGSVISGAYGGPRGLSDATAPASAPLRGSAALTALFASDEGVVMVRPGEQLGGVNVMAPLGGALRGAAASERVQAIAERVARETNGSRQAASDPSGVYGAERESSTARRAADRTLIGLGSPRAAKTPAAAEVSDSAPKPVAEFKVARPSSFASLREPSGAHPASDRPAASSRVGPAAHTSPTRPSAPPANGVASQTNGPSAPHTAAAYPYGVAAAHGVVEKANGVAAARGAAGAAARAAGPRDLARAASAGSSKTPHSLGSAQGHELHEPLALRATTGRDTTIVPRLNPPRIFESSEDYPTPIFDSPFDQPGRLRRTLADVRGLHLLVVAALLALFVWYTFLSQQSHGVGGPDGQVLAPAAELVFPDRSTPVTARPQALAPHEPSVRDVVGSRPHDR